jgi:hypothetical protein
VNISNNSSGGFQSKYSDAKLLNVRITDNIGQSCGGIDWISGELSLTDVKITNNSGGGVSIGDSHGEVHKAIVYLTNVTIAHNYANQHGIGGMWGSGNWIFNSEQRSNIYSNSSFDEPHDLEYHGDHDDTVIAVIVDTFSVLNPTSKYASPINKFTFDILHDASGLTDISEETNNLPTKFAIEQNYPNPFNPITKIKFALPKTEEVIILVYNTLGQKLTSLINQRMKAGYHEIDFNGQDLASGIYYYRIEAGDYRQVKKMILLK